MKRSHGWGHNTVMFIKQYIDQKLDIFSGTIDLVLGET